MALRLQQYNALVNTGEENIEFNVYDSDGNQLANVIRNVLIQAPTTLVPINENLNIEYERPLKKVIKETKVNSISLLNENPTFRYGVYNWSVGTVPNRTVEILQPNSLIGNIVPLSGLYCLYLNVPSNGDDKTNHIIKTIQSDTVAFSGQNIEIGFSYYIRSGNPTESVPSRFFISVGLSTTRTGSISQMYDFESNQFTTGSFTDDKFFKTIDASKYNKWNRYRTTLENIYFGTGQLRYLEVKLYPLSLNGVIDVSLSSVFIDNFNIGKKEDFTKIKHTKTNGVNTELLNQEPINNLTGEKKLPQGFLTNEISSGFRFNTQISAITGTFGREDRVDFANNTLDKLVKQEIINDYRSPLKKYEGDFYRDDASEIPIFFYHKIWINYGLNVLQDFNSATIDSMEYDVKANKYSLRLHLANIGSMLDLQGLLDVDDQPTFDTFEFD